MTSERFTSPWMPPVRSVEWDLNALRLTFTCERIIPCYTSVAVSSCFLQFEWNWKGMNLGFPIYGLPCSIDNKSFDGRETARLNMSQQRYLGVLQLARSLHVPGDNDRRILHLFLVRMINFTAHCRNITLASIWGGYSLEAWNTNCREARSQRKSFG